MPGNLLKRIFPILMVAVMIFTSILGYIPVPVYHNASELYPGNTVENVPATTVIQYTVTFVENGLPDGFTWALQFGSQYTSTQGNTVTFVSAPGTYNYFMYYGNQTSYIIEGTVSVDGNVAVSLNVYRVSIVLENNTLQRHWESCLRDFTGYSCTEQGNNSVSNYYVPAGSYCYSVYIEEFGRYVLLCDNYTTISNNLEIIQPMHSVAFREQGMPVGVNNLSWSACLQYLSRAETYMSRIEAPSNNSTFTVYLPYSTYFADYYVKIQNQGSTFEPAFGGINLSDTSDCENFTFSNLTVTAENLPDGAQWGIDVTSGNGTVQDFAFRSTNSSGSLYLLIGSYQYRYCLFSNYSGGKPTYVTPVLYNLSVPCVSSPIIANFPKVVLVTVEAIGLGPKTVWSSQVTGQKISFTLSGMNKTFYAYVTNGSYLFNFSAGSTSMLNGSYYLLNGSHSYVYVSFYNLRFNQTGLASFSAIWGIQLFHLGQSNSVSTNYLGKTTDISFYVINGSYSFNLFVYYYGYPSSYSSSYFEDTSSVKCANVSGSNQTVNIHFFLKPGYYYAKFIAQFNGPGNLDIRVSYRYSGGCNYICFAPSQSNQSRVVIVHNGTLQVCCYANGYQNYTFPSVNGSNITVILNFTWMQYSTVVFRETGLPIGTAWNITAGGETHSSNSSRIFFTFVNRSVLFSVAFAGSFYPSPATGIISISSRAQMINITFMSLGNISLGKVTSTLNLDNFNTYSGLFVSYPNNAPCIYFLAYNEEFRNQLAVSGDGSHVYMDAFNSLPRCNDRQTLLSYSGSTGSVVSFVNPTTYYHLRPTAIQFVGVSTNGSCIYLSSTNHLFFIDAQSLMPVGCYVIGSNGFTISSMIIDFQTGKMYAVDAQKGGMEVVGMNGSDIAYISLANLTGFHPAFSDFIVCDPNNGNLYVNYNYRQFVCLDTHYDVLGGTFNVSYFPTAATFIPDLNEIAVVGCYGVSFAHQIYNISLLDASNLHFIKNSTLQNQPTDLLYDQQDRMLYVSERNISLSPSSRIKCSSGTVTILDPTNLTKMGQILVGYNPDSIQQANGGATIFVSELHVCNLVVIHVSSGKAVNAYPDELIFSSIIIAASFAAGAAIGYALFYRRRG